MLQKSCATEVLQKTCDTEVIQRTCDTEVLQKSWATEVLQKTCDPYVLQKNVASSYHNSDYFQPGSKSAAFLGSVDLNPRNGACIFVKLLGL